jgi:hypothetical protein
MPDWSETGRLDLWEEHFQEVVPDGDQDSVPMRLVEQVFEFGRFNLHAAFDADRTAAEFGALATRFAEHGLLIDQHQSVSEW